MRPTRLLLSGFGPYVNKTCIDMSKLGQNGLYLITGDTGSGKTTIFDAITYALFGEASGNNREPNMLRSKYADPETPTQVELTFLYGGKEYHIRRNPDYERPSKRGDKITVQKAEAELTMPDGRVVSKIKDCNEAIKNILGIDRNQFAQIAMIAQGDFLKLLLATTEDRKKIFRQIFKTEHYLSLQDLLKNETSSLSRQCEALRNSVLQYADGILVSEEDILAVDLLKSRQSPDYSLNILYILNQIIDKDKGEKILINERLKILEQSISAVNERLGQAVELKKMKESLSVSKEKLPSAVQNVSNAKADLDREKARDNEREQLQHQIITISNSLSQYDELDAKITNCKQKRSELEKLKHDLIQLEHDLSDMTDQIRKYKNEFDTLKNADSEAESLLGKIRIAQDIMNKLYEISSNHFDLSQEKDKQAKLQTLYSEAVESTGIKRSGYLLLNRLFLDEQAGILSATLKAGLPCPVCGSTEHPAPASKSEIAPSEAEMEAAKAVLEAAESKERTISNQLGTLRGVISVKEDELIRKVTETIGPVDMGHLAEEISTQLKIADSDCQTLLKDHKKTVSDQNRKKALSSSILESEEKQNQMRISAVSAGNRVAALEALLTELENAVHEASGKLFFAGKKDALAEISRLSNMKTDLQKAYEQATLRYDEANSSLMNLQGQIDILSKNLTDREEIDEGSEIEEKIKLDEEKKKCDKAVSSLEVRLSSNLRARANIERQSEALSAAESRFSWVKSLSDTANGTLAGKEKIMLETYIQMTYFDRIINRANSRLMKMTGGQYELKRSDEAENNQKQSGLDLSVIDHYNGSERNVKTLSGGESFQASLSLALGLSDEIQSSAGGIRMDTMFVDEGFGSLDEESLRQAIHTLSGLSEGNRLVGIISHVSELKQRIDKQLIVTKDKVGGSHVTVIT